MSGRARVTLADGRRVTGYRKTLTQRARRTPAHLLPDWELSAPLPSHDLRFFGLNEGQYPGLIGLTVQAVGNSQRVRVIGKNRDWVVGQLVRFVRQVAPIFRGTIAVVLARGAEPGPTISGPTRAPERHACQIDIGPSRVTILCGTTFRHVG